MAQEVAGRHRRGLLAVERDLVLGRLHQIGQPGIDRHEEEVPQVDQELLGQLLQVRPRLHRPAERAQRARPASRSRIAAVHVEEELAPDDAEGARAPPRA